MKNIKRVGLALEGFGLTITTCGIADMTQWILIVGVVTSAAGRGLVAYAKE